MPERLALYEGHRVVEEPAGLATAQERDNVRMLEAGGELRLAPEPLDAYHFADLRTQHLEHDLSPERFLGGDEYARHPSTAELAVDGVGAAEGCLELVAQVEGHHANIGAAIRIARHVSGSTSFRAERRRRAVKE